MEVLIIITVFILILTVAAKRKSGKRQSETKQQPPSLEKNDEPGATQPTTNMSERSRTKDTTMDDDKQKAKELTEALLKTIKVQISPVSSANDDSIIDVSKEEYKIPAGKVVNTPQVPYWPHVYVYSFQDINRASAEQKAFYQEYKQRFLKGEYLDLQGNTNYAFILLFDLLNEYDKPVFLIDVEKKLQALAEHYPRTASYCLTFLVQKMQGKGDYDGIARIRQQYQQFYQPSEYEYRLGSKYKTKLNLTNEQEALANKLWYPGNNFCAIEFCLLQAIKLYLSVINELNTILSSQNCSLQKEFEAIAGLVATKQFRYRPGSDNYRYTVQSTVEELHRLLFKHAENALRDYYGHKRKLNTDVTYPAEAAAELQAKIISQLHNIFPVLLPSLSSPDELTEVELNVQNTGRWKLAFEKIKAEYGTNSQRFFEAIQHLGTLNKRNPSIENIFFEASKFIAKADRQGALTLYVYYLYYDLRSSTFDNKQLTKTIQKSLFNTNEELHEFERLISDLIQDKNLEKALSAVPTVFARKRKKIKLDTAAITEVHQKHGATVNLLGTILADEYEDANTAIKTQQVNKEEVEIEIMQKAIPVGTVAQSNPLSLTSVQMELLDMFSKHSFTLSDEELEAFARSKSLFKNSLVESVNEACMEQFDDLLIEQEDDNLIMNQQYYQTLRAV